MKQYIKNYSIVLLTLLFLSLLTSLILSFIESKDMLSYTTTLVIANSLSYVYLAILSIILGLKMKKNGLMNGIVFSLILFILTIIMGNNLSNITTIIKTITKSLIVIFFTLVGVNKKNSN